MRTIRKEIAIQVYEYGSLQMVDRELVAMAIAVRHNAQAPYSNYHVGAAAAFEDGAVFFGTNVESASYTQTTHAEQAAIVSAVARGVRTKLATMAVVGGPAGTLLTLPPTIIEAKRIQSVHDICPSCGHCLQIMWEQCGGDRSVRLLQLHPSGEVAITTMGDAFPMAFGPADLGIDVFARRT